MPLPSAAPSRIPLLFRRGPRRLQQLFRRATHPKWRHQSHTTKVDLIQLQPLTTQRTHFAGSRHRGFSRVSISLINCSHAELSRWITRKSRIFLIRVETRTIRSLCRRSVAFTLSAALSTAAAVYLIVTELSRRKSCRKFPLQQRMNIA